MPKKRQPAGVGMTPSRTELGRFIRARRLELDLRQVPLAELAGLAQNLVSMFEIGTRKFLNPKQLEGLAKALQCDPTELRKRMPEKRSPTTELGRMIRSRREGLGLTLKEFAQRMGLTLSGTRGLEMRQSPIIYCRSAKRLAEALGLDVSVFARFIGHKATRPSESELGRLVRARRQELWMSAAELARELRVTSQSVSNIELGKCSASEKNKLFERLAQVLKLDVDELQAVRLSRRPYLKRQTPLGRFVTERRLELRLRQKQVEQQAGIPRGVLCKIETGVYRPGPWILERISKALGCEIPRELL